MILKDDIYGTFDINEPVVLDLLRSYPLRRLRGINTAGYAQAFYPGQTRSRYEHSVGVFLLLRRFNASMEEQLAGLIHDVSHFAFSHAIDYILENGNQKEQTLQDDVFENFVKNSDLEPILRRYGYKVDYLLDEKNFPLKENSLPDICADRLDYSLNEAVKYGHRTLEQIRDLFSHLNVYDQKVWYFDTQESAQEYAVIFKELNDSEYSSIKAASMFKGIKDVMKYSLDKKYIDIKDFEQDDAYVLTKINRHIQNDTQLKKFWNRMNNKVTFESNSGHYEEEIWCKSRIVDPYFMDNGNLTRLSERYSDWKKVLIEEMKPKQYFINILDNQNEYI